MGKLHGHQHRLIDKINNFNHIITNWKVNGIGISYTIEQYVKSLPKTTNVLIIHNTKMAMSCFTIDGFCNVTQHVRITTLKQTNECSWDVIIFDQINIRTYNKAFVIDYIKRNKNNTKFIISNSGITCFRDFAQMGFKIDTINSIDHARELNNSYFRIKKINDIKNRINAKK